MPPESLIPDPSDDVQPEGEQKGGDEQQQQQQQQQQQEGERPTWLPETAWDPDAKSVKLEALETVLASAGKDQDVPAEGSDYTPPAIEGVDPKLVSENEAYQSFAKAAREMGMGQARFETFVKGWIDEANANEAARIEEVRKALGAEAPQRLQAISNGLKSKGLNDAQIGAVRQAFDTVEAIEGLEILLTGKASTAPRTPTVVTLKSDEEIRAIMATPAYTGDGGPRDPAVVKEVEDWFKAKYPDNKK